MTSRIATLIELRSAVADLERLADLIGPQDPVVVGRYHDELKSIAKSLRRSAKEYRGAQDRVIRDKGFAEIRKEWGEGTLIARIEAQEDEGAQPVLTVISKSELPDFARVAFTHALKKWKIEVRFTERNDVDD